MRLILTALAAVVLLQSACTQKHARRICLVAYWFPFGDASGAFIRADSTTYRIPIKDTAYRCRVADSAWVSE